ncbi:MAG: hypothetical protein JWR35_1045 [Marmoricola sp.]|nr:hypothetical protein [Marmoricola sp.]
MPVPPDEGDVPDDQQPAEGDVDYRHVPGQFAKLTESERRAW